MSLTGWNSSKWGEYEIMWTDGRFMVLKNGVVHCAMIDVHIKSEEDAWKLFDFCIRKQR